MPVQMNPFRLVPPLEHMAKVKIVETVWRNSSCPGIACDTFPDKMFDLRNSVRYDQQKLAKKEQELQELEAKLTQDIMLENQTLNQQLSDSLNNFLKEFNADGRYHVILSNTAKDNVLMANEQYDITDEVVNGLNARSPFLTSMFTFSRA